MFELRDGCNHVTIFVDESKNESNQPWMYTGFLLIPTHRLNQALEDTRAIRIRHNYQEEIHFSECDNHSKSQHGRKTSIAKDWIKMIDRDNSKTWHVFVSAFNTYKINQNLFGKGKEAIDNAYSRFFRSALKYCLKSCFNLPIYVDAIYHDRSHMENHPYFRSHPIYKIDIEEPTINFSNREIIFVDSDHRLEGNVLPEASEMIQIIDVAMGAFRQCHMAQSKKSGKIELGETAYDMVELITKPDMDRECYQRYGRRIAFRFFPNQLDNFYNNERLLLSVKRKITNSFLYLSYNSIRHGCDIDESIALNLFCM